MNKLIERVYRENEKRGLMINECKTKIMVIDWSLPQTNILTEYEREYRFICPGSVIRKDGSSIEEIRRWIPLAGDVLSKLFSYGKIEL